MHHKTRQIIAVTLVALISVIGIASVSAEIPANADFQRTWERTDKPVADLTVSRTWMWGPRGNTTALSEEYVDSEGGVRQVQYFDKSRMEINDPNAPRDLWYVTNGLLVDELIRGRIQNGDNSWLPSQPAVIPVAGDADDIHGPTYAALGQVLDADPLAEDVEISWRINSQGVVTLENPLIGHGVTAAYFDEETNHTVASPFWTFMNSSGTVWENGANVNANLFQNPFYATGRPITEAYWATVKVAGEVQDVLLQCFERRCLTYTPRNADGWKVEAGNVGQHYYAWRYGQVGQAETTIHLVSMGDGGPLGCGDTLVAVTSVVNPGDGDKDPVTQALNRLFSIDDDYYGESGLFNTLHASDLAVESVVINNGAATVRITGSYSVADICEEPRFIEQIRQTVLAADGVTSATILVNNIPLEDLFSQGELQEATIYVISTDDGGPVGCGDTLEPWTVSFHEAHDPITGALNALFALQNDDLGESGFINTANQPGLTAVSASVDTGHATVQITGEYSVGGACDDPRFVEQILQTVLAADGVDTADIFVNGTPLDELFNPMG